MAALRIIGVRHHSPACARRVEEVIRADRPAFVLIEGPADMNDRLEELYLWHRLPIAVYSYRLDEGEEAGPARGTWTPFCDYSPEWVALKEGAAVGSAVHFIDLPAWDDAFRETVNRYGEGRPGAAAKLQDLAERHGFDGSDALWDHLFEARIDAEGRAGSALEARLETYFDALRGDDEASERDTRREAFMAEWIRWALGSAAPDETVLVVCGGYHAPPLARVAEALGEPPAAPPKLEPPPRSRVGSFLVPFSFHRLDSFTGYAAGMPSPAYYQAVWEQGDEAPNAMLQEAVWRLRALGQVASTADYAAALTMAEALARIRGHRRPTRVDTLDALVSALLKEPLDAPLPWSERRPLAPGTAPMLVEIVAAYSGETRGALAEGTPRPPLVDDVRESLKAHGLDLGETSRQVELSPTRSTEAVARQSLHRLRVLEIPGVVLARAGSTRRGAKARAEVWTLQEREATLPTLIERAVYGATLAQASRARLLERVAEARTLPALVEAMEDAAQAGFPELVDALGVEALAAVEQEADLARTGEALDRLLSMERSARVEGREGMLRPLLVAVLERSLWLLEAAGASSGHAFRVDELLAVRAIGRVALELEALEPASLEATLGVLERVADHGAPFGLRGACLGALFTLPASDEDALRARAEQAIRGVLAPRLGELLAGLALLAREVITTPALFGAIDARVQALDDAAFLDALPPMRRAFGYFPPRERLALAKRLLEQAGVRADAGAFLDPVALDPEAARVERALFALLERYRLFTEN